MKKAILFDLDGTLLNTDLLIKKSFIHTFKKYKPDYTLSEEELLSFLGPSLKNTFSRYVENNQVDELIQYYRDYNHKHHENCTSKRVCQGRIVFEALRKCAFYQLIVHEFSLTCTVISHFENTGIHVRSPFQQYGMAMA